MKQLLLILTLILVYILFNAKGCEQDEQYNIAPQEKKIRFEIGIIKSTFVTESPSGVTLHAFEETARIKFFDFLDYLTIFSDSSIAPVFRHHAGQMISDLFISDNCIVNYINDSQGKKNKITIREIVNAGTESPGNICVVQPDSVWIENSLHELNDTIFTGKLGFRPGMPIMSTDLKIFYPAGRTMEFFAIKRVKNFGEDSLKVWTILLGDMVIP